MKPIIFTIAILVCLGTMPAVASGALQPTAVDLPVVAPVAPSGALRSGYVVLGLLAAIIAASGSF